MDITLTNHLSILKEINDLPKGDKRKEHFTMGLIAGLCSSMDIETATFFAYNKIKESK